MPPIKEWRAKKQVKYLSKKVDLYEMQLDISQNNLRVAARWLKIYRPSPAHSLKANVKILKQLSRVFRLRCDDVRTLVRYGNVFLYVLVGKSQSCFIK